MRKIIHIDMDAFYASESVMPAMKRPQNIRNWSWGCFKKCRNFTPTQFPFEIPSFRRKKQNDEVSLREAA